MAYAYTLGQVANMTPQEQLAGLNAKLFPPKYIVGAGYINTRQVAIEYLQELITKEKESK